MHPRQARFVQYNGAVTRADPDRWRVFVVGSMDDRTADTIRDLQQLQAAHARRQHALQLQAATAGRNTPIEVTIELVDVARSIADLEKQIRQARAVARDSLVADLAAPPAGNDPSVADVASSVAQLGQLLGYTEDSLRREISGVYTAFFDHNETDAAARDTRQKAVDDREYRAQKRAVLFYVAVIVLLFGVFITVLVR